MHFVQFSQGILADANEIDKHVTETQAEVNPHPDSLVNPFVVEVAVTEVVAPEAPEAAAKQVKK